VRKKKNEIVDEIRICVSPFRRMLNFMFFFYFRTFRHQPFTNQSEFLCISLSLFLSLSYLLHPMSATTLSIPDHELTVELVPFAAMQSDWLDMNWSGRYTKGQSWVRGSGLTFHQPIGGFVDLHDDDVKTFEFLYPNLQDLRAKGVAGLITKLETGDHYYIKTSTLAEVDAFLSTVRWGREVCPSWYYKREAILAKLTELTKDAVNPIFIVQPFDGAPELFFHTNMKGVIEELKEIVKIVAEHNVTQEWI
jgi:hypothetical protein